MSERMDVDEIIARNPAVDPCQLERGHDFLSKLRSSGIASRKYKLAPPLARRRASAGEGECTDPRTVHLGRRN